MNTRGGCGFPAPVFSPELWAFFVHVFLMLLARYFYFLAVFPDFISGSHNQGETGQNPQAPEKERIWA